MLIVSLHLGVVHMKTSRKTLIIIKTDNIEKTLVFKRKKDKENHLERLCLKLHATTLNSVLTL